MLTVYIAGLVTGTILGGAVGLLLGWRDIHKERRDRIEAQREADDVKSDRTANDRIIADWYRRALDIATEAFQPGGRFQNALPIGSIIAVDGFKWALENAAAIDELATVNWTYQHGLPPREQLARAVQAEVRYALDPRISQPAQDLLDKGKAEAAKVLAINPKVGDRVCNQWKVCGTVVKVNEVTVTVRSDNGNFSGIWPLDGLTRG